MTRADQLSQALRAVKSLSYDIRDDIAASHRLAQRKAGNSAEYYLGQADAHKLALDRLRMLESILRLEAGE